MQQSNNQLGLHLRLNTTLLNLINDVKRHNISVFQFFLAASPNDRYISFSKKEQKEFVQLIQENNFSPFIHSSYWINPSSGRKVSFENSQKLLSQEIALAKRLQVPYIVLHPGSATWFKKREDDPVCRNRGIEQVASMLNTILAQETDVTILLENTAHGNRSVGSDLEDFPRIKSLLNHPEKVAYCLDLAHAFVYGYEISKIEEFFTTLNKTMSLQDIRLIHFNDAAEEHASKKDKHAIPGTGNIGQDVLASYLNHQILESIPKIMELPNLSFEDITDIHVDISKWLR